MYLDWHEPVGPWDEFVLLRSRSGFATAPDDGQVLYSFTKDAGSPPVETHFLDHSLIGGWYYYTIILHSTLSDVWEVAGATSVLVPWDYDSTEQIWSYLPEYYRVVREGLTAGYSEVLFAINPLIYQSGDNQVDNDILFNFMSVFGWGYDILRSQIETTLSGFDPYTVHVNRLALLADMFGAVLPDTVPTQNNRNLVRNLALLYRKRGTLDGLRETLALTSGYDVDVYQGPNFLLSRDQSAFLPLDIPFWDPGTRYVTGDIVRYNNYYRQALQTSYGDAQAPPLTPTNNAYWSVNPFTQSTPFWWDPKSGTPTQTDRMHGWQVQRADTSATWLLGIGLGGVSPLTANPSGALSWQNTGSSVDTLVRSVPVLSATPTNPPDREDVVKYGIPVPRATELWVEGETYFRGDLVLYLGAVYKALTETTDVPTEETWEQVGFDDRVRIALSFYAHGPFVGTNGTGGINVKPWVAFYDETGYEVIARKCVVGGVIYDSFTKAGAIINGRLPDVGGAWSGTESWGQSADDAGGYAYPTASTRTVQGFTGSADGNVGTLFRRVKTRDIGVYFRRSDSSNFWFATQSALYKVVAGTKSQVGASYGPFVDNDHLTVQFTGSTITVKKNDTTVLTVTDGFNSSATGVGTIAEAV